MLAAGDLQDAPRIGIVAGLYASIEITDFFILQPEFLLVRAGDAFTEDASLWGPYDGTVRYIDRITYGTLPFLLKFRFGSVSFFAGPTPMFRLGNGKLLLRANDDSLQYDLDMAGLSSLEYLDGNFARFAFAVTGGVGVEFPVGRRGGVFLLESRGHYVLTNVLDPSVGSVYRAYGIMLMAGYGVDSRGRDLRRSRVR